MEDAGVKYINNSQSTSDSNKDLEVLENIPSNRNVSSPMIPSLDTTDSYMPLKKTHAFSNLRNHRYPFIKKRRYVLAFDCIVIKTIILFMTEPKNRVKT